MSDLYYETEGQIITITSAKGTGKSIAAATFLPPGRVGEMFVHDSERSMNRIIQGHKDLGTSFGYYNNLDSRFSNLPTDNDLLSRINKGNLPWVDTKQRNAMVDYYEYILDDIDKNLTRGKYSVYIHDTLEKLESGMAAWVESNKKDAGVRSTAFGKLWTTGVYPLYQNLCEAIFDRGVKTIILTSHLKNPWVDNKPVVNKVVPSGKKILYKLSALMLWLVNEPKNPNGEPAAIVLKERMVKMKIKNGKWAAKRVIPPRIPLFTWDVLNEYIDKELYDINNPKDGEILSDEEKDMISEMLNDKQMELMLLAQKQDVLEAQAQAGMLGTTVNREEKKEFNPITGKKVSEEDIAPGLREGAIPPALRLAIENGKSNLEIKSDLSFGMKEIIDARRKIENE